MKKSSESFLDEIFRQSLIRTGLFEKMQRQRKFYLNSERVFFETVPGCLTAKIREKKNPKPFFARIRIPAPPCFVWEPFLSAPADFFAAWARLLKPFRDSKDKPVDVLASFLDFSKPEGLEFSCSCRNPASFCRHLASLLLEFQNRLKKEPSLFLKMRGAPERLYSMPVSANEPLPASVKSKEKESFWGESIQILDFREIIQKKYLEMPDELPSFLEQPADFNVAGEDAADFFKFIYLQIGLEAKARLSDSGEGKGSQSTFSKS